MIKNFLTHGLDRLTGRRTGSDINIATAPSTTQEEIPMIEKPTKAIGERSKYAKSEKVKQRVNNFFIPNFKMLTSIEHTFYALARNPDDEYGDSLYEDWTTDEIKELYFVLYGKKMEEPPEDITKPIQFKTFEVESNGIFNIFIESSDPRFEEILKIYRKFDPDVQRAGIGITRFQKFTKDGIYQENLDETRKRVAEMILEMQTPDFMERIEVSYAKYVKAIEEMRKAKEELRNIMPSSTAH